MLNGGTLPSSYEVPFQAGLADGSSSNVEVNIFGGVVGPKFRANSGSRVNISGGSVGSFFEALDGSVGTLSGGNDVPSGSIEQEELDRVLLNSGATVEPLAAASVPEPATIVILFAVALAWIGTGFGSRN